MLKKSRSRTKNSCQILSSLKTMPKILFAHYLECSTYFRIIPIYLYSRPPPPPPLYLHKYLISTRLMKVCVSLDLGIYFPCKIVLHVEDFDLPSSDDPGSNSSRRDEVIGTLTLTLIHA